MPAAGATAALAAGMPVCSAALRDPGSQDRQVWLLLGVGLMWLLTQWVLSRAFCRGALEQRDHGVCQQESQQQEGRQQAH